jgi:long-chain acyl-CoA synthetase
VPLNPLYGEEELTSLLVSTGAEVLLTLNPFYTRVKAVQARTAVRRVIATSIKEYLPPGLRVLFTLLKEKKEGHRIALAPGDLLLSSLLREHARAAPPAVTVGPEDPALILLSGGTTGTPKGVVCPHRALVITGPQTRAWYSEVLREWEDTILLPLPLFHAFAGVAAQSLVIVARARLALIPNPRDLKDVIATMRRVRPSFFAGVPTLFSALLEHPQVAAGRGTFRSLKACVSGAAPLLTETKRRLEALTGGRIFEGYSLTEALIASAVNPAKGPSPPGSVGLPLPDVEMRIVDVEEGTRELPPGEVGEVLIRAPQIMPGYWRDPEETARVLRQHGEGGPWLYTGDLGRMDEDGFLFIVDRRRTSSRSAACRSGRVRSKRSWPRTPRWPRSAWPACPTRSRGRW